MSTPTGKPFNPVNLSDYAPKKVRDRAASEGQPRAGDPNAADRASETPKMPWQQPAEARPADDADHHEAPLAPTGPHERPDDAPDEGDEGHPPSQSKPKGAHVDEDAAAEGNSEDDYDHDLRRLESSLQRLRRERAETEETFARLPRASQLPPVAGLRPLNASGRDTYIDGFRVPRSLDPTLVPPPPLREKRANHLGLVLRVAVACAIAVPIAYYFSVGGAVAPSKSDKGPTLSSAGTRVVEVTPGRPSAPQAPQVPPAEKQADQVPAAPMPATPGLATQVPASPPVVRSDAAAPPSRGETVGMLPTGVNPAPPAPASTPARTIDAEAVKLLLTQGEQFVHAGDLVTARVLFRHAAEAGAADGALALGATYDPGVLAKLGVRGIAGDADQARSWYEKARDLGSLEAPRRLKILADR